MRKKLLKINVLFLITLFGMTGIQAQVKMNFKEKSGIQTAYPLNEIKKITFSSGKMLVDNRGEVADLTNVIYWNFKRVMSEIPNPLSTSIKIALFPNPVADELNIRLSSEVVSKSVIEILSLEGKIIYTQTLNCKTLVHQIDVSNLPKGLYVCKINDGTSIEISKFIKQ
mgnify:CR=1 FL=1